jgi:hypothetical protein
MPLDLEKSAADEADGAPEVFTDEMVSAGEDVLLRHLGGAVEHVHWYPRDLAVEVFLAMRMAAIRAGEK